LDENAILKKVIDLMLNGDKWVRRGINTTPHHTTPPPPPPPEVCSSWRPLEAEIPG